MTWDPDTYPVTIRAEVHDYEALQEHVAQATSAVKAASILDFGVGAGETARRVLDVHPTARLVGVDSNRDMLDAAARALPAERVTLLQQELSAPVPDQEFDLVVSALAIHHLQGEGKVRLFRDIAQHLHSEDFCDRRCSSSPEPD